MKEKHSKYVGRVFAGGWRCVGAKVESVSPSGKKTYAYEVVSDRGESAWLSHSQIAACDEGMERVDGIVAMRRERFAARNADRAAKFAPRRESSVGSAKSSAEREIAPDGLRSEYLMLKRAVERFGIENKLEESEFADVAPKVIVLQELRIIEAHLAALKDIVRAS